MNGLYQSVAADAAPPRSPGWRSFCASATSARTGDECRRVREEAVHLLERGGIAVSEYATLFGGHARHVLTRTPDGRFRYVHNGADADPLVRRYSRAKHGSSRDIAYWVRDLMEVFVANLDHPGSALHAALAQAREHGDYLVLFGTGMRNVAAASNLMCELFVDEANIALVARGYPTIAHVRLPRIAPPCDNYAQLNLEERVRISLVQDHVLPAANFYQGNGVHVLFADDVLITGATADKVYVSALAHGARSFHALYPVLVDPVVALREPDVEDGLNTAAVGARIDDALLEILTASGHVPVLRTLRLLFSQVPDPCFQAQLTRLGPECVSRLYRSALGADFHGQAKYAPALAAVRSHLGLHP